MKSKLKVDSFSIQKFSIGAPSAEINAKNVPDGSFWTVQKQFDLLGLKITAIYPFSQENEARFSQFDSNSQQPLKVINFR